MEGLFETTDGRAAGDHRQARHRARASSSRPSTLPQLPVVPDVAATGTSALTGLERHPHEPAGRTRSPLVYYAYHIMVGLGTILHASSPRSACSRCGAAGCSTSRRAAVGADARLPVHVHREHRGLDRWRRPGASRGSSTACMRTSARRVAGGVGARRARRSSRCSASAGLYLLVGLLYLVLIAPDRRPRARGDAARPTPRGGRAPMSTAWFVLPRVHDRRSTSCWTASTSASARCTCCSARDRGRARRRPSSAIGPVWNGNEVWLHRRPAASLFLALPRGLRGGLQRAVLRADPRAVAARRARPGPRAAPPDRAPAVAHGVRHRLPPVLGGPGLRLRRRARQRGARRAARPPGLLPPAALRDPQRVRAAGRAVRPRRARPPRRRLSWPSGPATTSRVAHAAGRAACSGRPSC